MKTLRDRSHDDEPGLKFVSDFTQKNEQRNILERERIVWKLVNGY